MGPLATNEVLCAICGKPGHTVGKTDQIGARTTEEERIFLIRILEDYRNADQEQREL